MTPLNQTAANNTSIPGIERLYDTDLAHEVEFLAARAASRGNAHANAMLKSLNLKVRQYSVLSLAASGHKPSQRELGEFLNLDPSQIVSLVDDLQNRGLVQRETDDSDRRSKTIVATDAGIELYNKAREITQGSADDTLATLSPRERKQLQELLLRVAF